MTGADRMSDDVLAGERAVNEQYLRRLRDARARWATVAGSQVTTRNQQWTRPNVARGTEFPVTPIVGRVALDGDDELLGGDFYIGARHTEWSGVQVVSWAAPVASLFYRGTEADDPLAGGVVARRTFQHQVEDLVGYVDEVERPASGRSPFDTRPARHLVVPAPPDHGGRGTVSLPPTHSADDQDPPRVVETTRSRTEPTGKVEQAGPAPVPVDSDRPALRAESVLRAILERPRTGRLASVLATLQPDQYRLVTWPDSPLIIQGQPGTGKTVVAAHRAVYLAHPDRPGGSLQKVGLLGPTDRYAEHVAGVVRELGGDDVYVHDLPALLRQLAGVGNTPLDDTGDEQRLDTDWRLGRLLDRAVAVLRASGRFRTGSSATARALVDALVTRHAIVADLVEEDADIADWLAGLRSFDRARQHLRYLPFLAAAGVALSPPPSGALLDHLVVDEAQDVRPLEWRIVAAHVRGLDHVTLFGDINQRRSDFSPDSWHRLACDLEITDHDGSVPTEELVTGYRTTAEILRFANRLLPRGQRGVRSIRSGPAPRVERIPPAAVVSRVMRTAMDLAEAHARGTVAVITVQPDPVSREFRRAGWTRPPDFRGWARQDRRVAVLRPVEARGLEFDAVVVVEPAEFPSNLGRHGELYTSLTRAVQELVVVHGKPLPGPLR